MFPSAKHNSDRRERIIFLRCNIGFQRIISFIARYLHFSSIILFFLWLFIQKTASKRLYVYNIAYTRKCIVISNLKNRKILNLLDFSSSVCYTDYGDIMEIKRKIKVFSQLEDIIIKYYEYEHDKSDNAITIYDSYKFGIHLTDGLAAVMNENIIYADKGDIFVFTPKEVHFGRFLKSGIFRHIDFYIPLTFFDSFSCPCANLKNVFNDCLPERTNCIRPRISDKVKIIHHAEKIIDLITDYTEENNIYIFTLIIEILLLSSQIYPEQTSTSNTIALPSQILNTISYITNNFHNNISLQDIADYSHCSVTYLSRIFTKYMGISIYKYLIDYRINQSAILLKSGNSVTDACYSCGFNDCSNFIKTFKKSTGITPQQYKNM